MSGNVDGFLVENIRAMLVFSWLAVCPTYCFLHLAQEIR